MASAADRIPIHHAHEILAIFGVTEPTAVYERRVKDDGIDRDGLWDVVTDGSRFVFIIDWRATLPEELSLIAPALAELGAELAVDVPGDADDGWVSCEDRCAAVKYRAADKDDFTDVIRALQRVVPPAIEFRAWPDNADNDAWTFAALLREEWAKLESLDTGFVSTYFPPLPDAT
jgi:hypothetical protein